MSDATDETIATMLSASLTGNINGYARVRGPWPSRGSVLLRRKRDRSRLHRARSSRLARLQDRYIPLFMDSSAL